MLDVQAVYWKELKDLFTQGNKQMGIRLLIVAATGVWIPWQIGISWLQLSLLGVAFLALYPIILVITFVADVFAGERERHTLESLLATRLSDWSIVVGKGAALITLSGGMTILSTILSFVAVNIQAGGGHKWTFYPMDRLLAVLLLSLTLSVLAITIGILVSLRAPTVRQAQQTLMFGMFGMSAIGTFAVAQIFNLPFMQQLQGLSMAQILLLISACITVIDVALIVLVLTRFQRSRLILS